MSNQILLPDRKMQNQEGYARNQNQIISENPQSIINHVRRSQENMFPSELFSIPLKITPAIYAQNKKGFSGNASSDQNAIKQIENIKQKHSQKFKDSHFSMERIGLEQQSFSQMVYKKQATNCIHSIKQYINRNNFGLPQEITMPIQQKYNPSQQIVKDGQQNQHPIYIQSHQNDNKTYLNIKNNNNNNVNTNGNDNKRQVLKTEGESEYGMLLQKQLRDIFIVKRKVKDSQDNTVQSNPQKRRGGHSKNAGSIDIQQQMQETLDPLPPSPRYLIKSKSPNPQKLTLKTRMTTGVSSPINNQSIFSPPRKITYNKLSPVNTYNNSALNQSQRYSPLTNSMVNKNKNIIGKPRLRELLPSAVKQRKRKSDLLYESMFNKQNNILVDGSVFNQAQSPVEKKSNQLRYSKDDMNQTLSELFQNKMKNLQYRKHSSPIRLSNQYKKNQEQSREESLPIQAISSNYKQNTENELTPKVLQKSKEMQRIDKKNNEYNTDFLKIQNVGRKYAQNKYNKISQQVSDNQCLQVLDNSQFEDSQILNNNSSFVKIQQSSVNIPRNDYLLVDAFSKNQSTIINPKEQQLTGNSNIMLDSMIGYEEASQMIEQSEVEKQSKANKYLSKLGLNNRYSKKDYLKALNNSSINQSFLDINFDNEQLIPKQRSQLIGKAVNLSQLTEYDDKIQNSINYTKYNNNNNNQRCVTTQPQTSPKINQIHPQTNLSKALSHYQKDQQSFQIKYKEQIQAIHSQNNKDSVSFPRFNSNSPDLSRNMSILQQCEKESKNIGQLSKKWESNIDKIARERSKYNQKFRYLKDENNMTEKSLVYQYYQNQRFNTDI